MSYNNYVDADAALRAAHDHDDRQPSPSSSTRIRVGSRSAPTWLSPSQGARVRPGVGVRRSDRGQPPVSVAMAEQVADVFTEVIVAPAYDDGAVEVLPGQEEHPHLSAQPLTRGGVETRRRSPEACSCSSGGRAAIETGVTTRQRGHSSPERPPTLPLWPTWLRLEGLPRREVQRDPARQATAPRSASAWARSTGSTPAASRWRAPATGPRGRWRPRTRSSRSRTARRSSSTPG